MIIGSLFVPLTRSPPTPHHTLTQMFFGSLLVLIAVDLMYEWLIQVRLPPHRTHT